MDLTFSRINATPITMVNAGCKTLVSAPVSKLAQAATFTTGSQVGEERKRGISINTHIRYPWRLFNQQQR